MVHKAELVESQLKRRHNKPSFTPNVVKPKDTKPATTTVKEVVKTEFKRKRNNSLSNTRCFKCQGMGHYSRDCPNRKVFLLQEGGEIVPKEEEEHETDNEEEEEAAVGEMLVTRRTLSVQSQPEETCQCENIFHTRCYIKGKVCSLIIVGGSNAASEVLVQKLQLETIPHPKPYKLQWLNESGALTVSHQVKITLTIGKYKDEVLCDVLPMRSSHVLLGRPWQSDRKVTHNGYTNKHSFEYNGRKVTPLHLTPGEIYQDQLQLKLKNDQAKGKSAANSLYINYSEVSKLLNSDSTILMFVYKESLVSTNVSQELSSGMTKLLQDYSDVFPEDIPQGLPPIRGIEHQIDFVPGSALPNKPAYRTNPVETKELQKQVED
ncbi:hypothetical protein N665_0781s0004 [Sinapis alba]|nr:hypothetical protein N665_0781s0004 [Sinapis alba]